VVVFYLGCSSYCSYVTGLSFNCPLLLFMVRVLVFTMINVVEMDMWRPSATGRGKLRRLKLVVLHRVLVVLVLEDQRGVLLLQRHRR
jgi:hypothetical protein